MLFIAGVPGEDPAMIASKADVILQADELGMGKTVIEQAKKMGAKTFVHYSFPRHMSYELQAFRIKYSLKWIYLLHFRRAAHVFHQA